MKSLYSKQIVYKFEFSIVRQILIALFSFSEPFHMCRGDGIYNCYIPTKYPIQICGHMKTGSGDYRILWEIILYNLKDFATQKIFKGLDNNYNIRETNGVHAFMKAKYLKHI